MLSWCRLEPPNSSSVNNDLNRSQIRYSNTLNDIAASAGAVRHCEKRWAGPQSRHDLMVSLRLPDVGSFSGSLTSPKHVQVTPVNGGSLGWSFGARGGWSELIRNSRLLIVPTW